MKNVKQIDMRPYPGTVIICKSFEDYQRQHKKLFGYVDNEVLPDAAGRMSGTIKDNWRYYLVWAKDESRLAHELAHCILHIFHIIGIDPREGNGEPFCYMLSQLMLDAK